ncbi:MAG: hypothetical protein U9N73_07115, partial [Candidatus Auribacterota bacterium]|nr:hypothetical protein [Candidatus Auribacterota bacterium]
MSRIKYYHLLLIVVLLGAGTLYLPSLHYPFVWDDMAVVRDNPYIRSSGSIGLFFQPSFWQKRVPISRFDYRPLQMIVLSAISRLAGANPFFFRAANILIHLLVTCLLWRFILLVGGGRRIALLAAALFAFHPVHVETVVSARNISVLLVAAFLLLSFLLFFRRGGIVTLTLSVSFFLLALLCKESALIYPPILTATVLILRRRFPGISLWRTVPFWIGAVAGGVGKILISSGGPLRDPPALSNLVVGGIRQIGINLRLLILPAQLKVLYSFNKPVSWTRPEWFLPLLVGAGLILIAFKLYRDNRLLFWSIFCLIFSLLPSLAKIGQIGRVVAEQRLYLPSIFFCAAFAVLLNSPKVSAGRRRLRLLMGIFGF